MEFHTHVSNKLPLLLALIGLWSTGTLPVSGEDAPVRVTHPRCEYLVDPIGIDQTRPRLSWEIESSLRSVKQTAYRILVASKPELLAEGKGDLWDSGKIESDETTNVVYAGRALESRARCYWQVHVWCQAGKPCQAESDVAQWTIGLLTDADWNAEYISYRDDTPVFKDTSELFLPAARQYRKGFATRQSAVTRATLYATALGIYELEVNGQRVGDAWFAPGWTDYRQRAYYQTYDVTPLIKAGDNALSAWVADGWYSGYVGFGLLTGIGTERIGRYTYGKTPAIMAQLELEYADGTRERVATDKSWKVTGEGPIQEADMLMGEHYDARREMPDWSSPGFDDSQWQSAIAASENGHPRAMFYEYRNPESPGVGPTVEGREIDLGFRRPKLEAFPGVPVRVTEEIAPVAVTTSEPGKTIYNLGQNIAGSIRLAVRGSAGQVLQLRYGEMLYPDGRLMTENLRKARATDHYVLKGDPNGETYTPRFTFHGFQYVELSVRGGQQLAAPPAVTGLLLHSDTPLVSSFECSDPMANRLFKNVVYTQRANFIDLPTDCPQRDERMGWTGDAQVYVGTAAFNADVAAFYTKWLRELMESQRPSGAFPGYAPFPFQHGWDFGTAWADAGVICPWTIWQAYGDTRVIEVCWEPMTRFLQWRKQTSRHDLGVVHGNEWGDWLAQGAATPLDYIDTIYFAISSRMMAEMAAAIEKQDEATAYREQFARIKTAFNAKYVREDGSLHVDTQTAYALALFADLIPEALRVRTGQKLADMIRANGTRMSTGFLGTRPLLPVLSSVGQHDLAVFLFQSREFPSWGYEVEQGATTIWERWDSYTKEDGFGRHNAAMNSFAHYSFGAVCEWMFRTLAGVESDGTGYRKISIRPTPPSPGSNAERKPIDWVKASYRSVQGQIVSNWRVTGQQFDLQVTIPANTTATLYLPAQDAGKLREGGKPLAQAQGVKFVRMEGDRAIVTIGSGSYRFTSSDAMRAAKTADKTSEPLDLSANPDNINLTGATAVASWNFNQDADVAKWSQRHNLQIERREGKTMLVGTGADPQLATLFEEPMSGPLVLELEAAPAKGTTAQFFWAAADGGFNSTDTIARSLNATPHVRKYLFRIGSGQPIQTLRFDPFSNEGELQIESITLYRLPAAS
ncbi:MAG: family 78 glycoside hydrolase catalytic domain [Pirellulaceae bacterium]